MTSFEKNILNSIKNKKKNNINKKKNSLDDYTKKITYILFFVFLIYISYNLFKNNDFNKNILKNNQIDLKKEKENNIFSDKSDNNTHLLLNQKYYTIVDKKFILKNNDNSDIMYVNLTKKDNDDLNINIDHSIILDFKKSKNENYLNNFKFIDKNKTYVLFLDNINDIVNVKEYLENNNIKKIFFNII